MQISDAEWRLMKILWMRGSMTSSQLIKIIRDQFEWTDSTVKTLLSRLVKKSMVERNKVNGFYEYHALLTQDDAICLMTEDIRDKVCSRKVKNLISKLIDECDFTSDDINTLRNQLEDKKREAVGHVTCNCL
ncbi:CopY/TcrY family copper transport repressor [Alloscardovia theropitheci]|uniref:CopY/TcrY family copper transport repressor n=1 Tax=Alloscardovia theropitheci TaxID=2496842 RepID=A0A4R0QQ13_9BIFI|nr:CopY/TcrY family copper transport repressor [Alloscardovia theropitheci]TCD54353.1 CopY/TcrY family copper transport repressor [Alloscardovia theropitheci]